MGSGWAAHFLRAGLDVVACDPNPAAEGYVQDTIERAWPRLAELGLAAGASRGRLRFTTELGSALADADFVQESAPEDESLKMELLRDIDARAAPDVVVASSSSGFLAARLRSRCARGSRVLVGHPFNPPYLIPLVEVVGGEGADPAAVAAAVAFYRSVHSHPIVLRKDILGYVANRLQLAMMREIFHLVAEDVASVRDIDDAIAFGPGLRWAVMGPCQVFKLGSQRPEQFGRFLDLLVEEIDMGCVASGGPTIRPGVREALIRGLEEAQGGAHAADLIARRDAAIVAFRRALGIQ
jgi:3-hydroxyacyl-CoA dehydrogenase